MKSRNYSAIYRIMHWSIAICMTLMLITIFLRMTWMNKNHVAQIIQEYLSTTDQSLSQDQLIILAKKIRKPMWDWHIYFGYALVGLYSIRMALPLFGQMKFSNPFNKDLGLKEKFQYATYLVFYVCVAISLITGLIIVLGPKNLKESMESIHVLSIYYLLAFIVIHLSGVFFCEFTNHQGLISKIISGSKKTKEN
ncbi:cytochrome b/b6 domain-containing protein [Flavobacterium sp. W20_MBD1_R3]|uniref:cytochrome b/b6 domain-containing protein n=1 Tax=Flavobacterium sp. W20_MBD1_R3 TaxID=3240278 RepID=UPI003F8FFF98